MIDITNNIIIATSRYSDVEYDFTLENDISKKIVSFSKSPFKYNSRYMEFEIDLTALNIEEGFGILKIYYKSNLIYEDIYFNKFTQTDTFEYDNNPKKYVYKKK